MDNVFALFIQYTDKNGADGTQTEGLNTLLSDLQHNIAQLRGLFPNQQGSGVYIFLPAFTFIFALHFFL